MKEKKRTVKRGEKFGNRKAIRKDQKVPSKKKKHEQTERKKT